jgi:hypothetical protein
MVDKPEQDELQGHYNAMLDCVDVINYCNNDPLASSKWHDIPATIQRNKGHLEYMLSNDWWDGFDLAPIQAVLGA